MLLLAVDTSGRQGSIALARVYEETSSPGEESNPVEVLEVVSLSGGTFSAQLVPQIAMLLSSHGFTKHELGAFVVVSGPGSFTGLRIGLAAVKALGEILGKPIAAISLLEILALRSGAQGRVVSALDAGRGEVYVGEFEIGNVAAEKSVLLQERLLSQLGFLAVSRGSNLVTSDEVVATTARNAGLSISVIEPTDAGIVAQLGWRKIQAGETVSPEQLDANYIRRTDAEILAKIGS
jgi:tRNA threonylcarbamoyladenosine biosynthesis protein TsaB